MSLNNEVKDGIVKKTVLEKDKLYTAVDKKGKEISGGVVYTGYRTPELVVTKSNSILCFLSAKPGHMDDHGKNDCIMIKSNDNGITWSKIHVIDSESGLNCAGTPVYDYLEDTVVLLSYRFPMEFTEKDLVNKNAKRELWISKSKDDGNTWSHFEQVSLENKRLKDSLHSDYSQWGFVNTISHGIQLSRQSNKLKNGRLVVPANHTIEKEGEVFWLSHILYSDDKGYSWNIGALQDIDGTSESCIVELSNGEVLLNSRDEKFEDKKRVFAISKDGGESFNSIYKHDDLYDPRCHAGMISFKVDEYEEKEWVLFVNPTGETGDFNERRRDLTVKISHDAGKTFSKSRLINIGWTAYSDICITKDKKILVAYETGTDLGDYSKIEVAVFDFNWFMN